MPYQPNAASVLEELGQTEEGIPESQMRRILDTEITNVVAANNLDNIFPAFAPLIAVHLAQNGNAEKATLEAVLGSPIWLNISDELREKLEKLLDAQSTSDEDRIFFEKHTRIGAQQAASKVLQKEDVTLAELLPFTEKGWLDQKTYEALARKILDLDQSENGLKTVFKMCCGRLLSSPFVKQIIDRYLALWPEERAFSDARSYHPEYRVEIEAKLQQHPEVVKRSKSLEPLSIEDARAKLKDATTSIYEIINIISNVPDLEEEAWTSFVSRSPRNSEAIDCLRRSSQAIKEKAVDYLIASGFDQKDLIRALQIAPQFAEKLWANFDASSLTVRNLIDLVNDVPALEQNILNLLKTQDLNTDALQTIFLFTKSEGSAILQHFSESYLNSVPAGQLGWLFDLRLGEERKAQIIQHLDAETDLRSIKDYCKHNFSGGKNVWLNACWKKIAQEGTREDLFEMLQVDHAAETHFLMCWEKFKDQNPTKDELMTIASKVSSVVVVQVLFDQYDLSPEEKLTFAKHRYEAIRKLAWSHLKPDEMGRDKLFSIASADAPGMWHNGESEWVHIQAFQTMEGRNLLTQNDAFQVLEKNIHWSYGDHGAASVAAVHYLVDKHPEAAGHLIQVLSKELPLKKRPVLVTDGKNMAEKKTYYDRLGSELTKLPVEGEEASELQNLLSRMKESVVFTSHGVEEAVNNLLVEISAQIQAASQEHYY